MTDELLESLTTDLVLVSDWYVVRRLIIGAGVGAALSAALMVSTLGLRPDFRHVVSAGVFWLKQLYTLAFALVAGFAAERLARPAASARGRTAWLPVPFLVLAGIAAVQLATTSPGGRMATVMGISASICPWRIVFFAIPPSVGLIWAMRGLAPTRLRKAGAAIGLVAGGTGAFVYALHCSENAALFVTVWYTLGMIACALLGWALGPMLLRWR